MRRPTHQAKLILLGLLKTATALASTSTKAAATTHLPNAALHHHHHSNLEHQQQHTTHATIPICLRLATPDDVPAISNVNLATLPENYNHLFYMHHLQQYPSLSFVAEYQNTIVGYCLGKIVPNTKNTETTDHGTTTTSVGHVSSLAILPTYRRLGLAKQLLRHFHAQLLRQNRVVYAGLHVRQSNVGAQQLYHALGYCSVQSIPCYYEDGEDALYMKKVFDERSSQTTTNKPRLFSQFLPSVVRNHHVANRAEHDQRKQKDDDDNLLLPRYIYPTPLPPAPPPQEEEHRRTAGWLSGTLSQ